MPLEATITRTDVVPAHPGKRAALAILVSMSAIYFFSFFQRVAVPGTIFDELQSALHTSAGLIMGFSTLYLWIYGGMQFIAGVLNDRYGAARVMLASGLLLSLGSIFFPLCSSLPWLYTARVFVSLGAGLTYVSLFKALDELFSPLQLPLYLGTAMFLGYAVGLTGTFPFQLAVRLWGWRDALLGAGILCALAFFVTGILFKKTGRLVQRPPEHSPLAFGQVIRNKASFPLLLAAPANFSVYFFVQSTLGKKFLADYCGVSGTTATSFTFLMMVCAMSIMLLSGWLTRLLGHRRKLLIIAAIGMAFVGSAFLVWGVHAGFGRGWFLLCYILLALSNMSTPLSLILMKELNVPAAMGMAVGMVNGLFYVFIALLTMLAGMIMDHFQSSVRVTATAVLYPREAYLAIFLMCAVVSLAALICSFFLRESLGRSLDATAQSIEIRAC